MCARPCSRRAPRNAVAPIDELILDTIAATAERYNLTEAQVRDYVYHSVSRLNAQGDPIPPNGLAQAVVRVNGRVLLDRTRMRAWLEAHRGLPNAPVPSTRPQQRARKERLHDQCP